MKRLFIVFMSLMFIMCLAGCNKSNMQSNKESDTQLLSNEDQKNIDKAPKNNDIEKNNFNLKKLEIKTIHLGKSLYSSIYIDIDNQELINDIFEIINVDYIKSLEKKIDIVNAFWIDVLYEDGKSINIYILNENNACLFIDNDAYVSEKIDSSKIKYLYDIYYERFSNMTEHFDINNNYNVLIDKEK